MLRCTVEILRYGDPNDVREIATIRVANVGGDREVADYGYIIDAETAQRMGRLSGYKRAKGALGLLYAILKQEGFEDK